MMFKKENKKMGLVSQKVTFIVLQNHMLVKKTSTLTKPGNVLEQSQ